MQTSIATRSQATSATGFLGLSPVNKRRFLLLSLTDGAAFKVQLGTGPDATTGIFVPTGRGYIMLTYDEIGDALTGPVNVIAASGAAATVVIAEGIDSL